MSALRPHVCSADRAGTTPARTAPIPNNDSLHRDTGPVSHPYDVEAVASPAASPTSPSSGRSLGETNRSCQTASTDDAVATSGLRIAASAPSTLGGSADRRRCCSTTRPRLATDASPRCLPGPTRLHLATVKLETTAEVVLPSRHGSRGSTWILGADPRLAGRSPASTALTWSRPTVPTGPT